MPGRLRVLHVWNTAGVASVIAKYQERVLGWDAWVVMRREWDPYGFTTHGEVWDVGPYMFTLRALLKARGYDVIHVHAFDKFVPLARRIYRQGKRIVLHYHGTDIRGRWQERRRYWEKADLILVSTPDLLDGAPGSVHYLPNPVDTELFRPLGLERREAALVMVKRGRSHVWRRLKPVADELSRKLGIPYEVRFLDTDPVPHRELPLLLNRYEYFMDLPHGFSEEEWLIRTLSKTGLEALACGTKVIRWDGEIIEGLPEEHRPENVVRRLARLLEEL